MTRLQEIKKREEEAKLLEARKRDIVQYQDDKSEKRKLLGKVANKKVKNKVLIEAFLASINCNVNSSYSALKETAQTYSSGKRFSSAVIDIALRVYFDALDQVNKAIEEEDRANRQKELDRQAYVKMLNIGQHFQDLHEQPPEDSQS